MSTVAYPHKTLPGYIDLEIRNVEVDGQSVDPFIETDECRVDLFKSGPEDWDDANVYVTARHPTEALRDYVEPALSDLTLTAVAHCSSTSMRQTAHLGRPNIGDDYTQWSGEMKLPRFQYAEEVKVKVTLSGPLGSAPDRYLGESQSWSVWFGEPPTYSITGSIEILWNDFSDPEEKPDLTDYRDQVFYLDLGSKPTLYLNESFEGLYDLLEGGSAEEVYEDAFRESEYYSIAQSAWLAMFNAAASSVREENGQYEFPGSSWKRKVLEKMLPKLMPEHSTSDALRKVHACMQGDIDPWIQSEALSVVDNLLERSAALESMFDRIDRSESQSL